jgi:hypothetical protein
MSPLIRAASLATNAQGGEGRRLCCREVRGSFARPPETRKQASLNIPTLSLNGGLYSDVGSTLKGLNCPNASSTQRLPPNRDRCSRLAGLICLWPWPLRLSCHSTGGELERRNAKSTETSGKCIGTKPEKSCKEYERDR